MIVKQLRVVVALAVGGLLVASAVAWAATITGTNGNDFLPGTQQSDRISARGGDDIVYGLRGNDRIVAASGSDLINGDGTCPAGVRNPNYCSDDETQGGNDKISAGSGNDVAQGGKGNDTIFARDGERDVIHCGPGFDRVYADRADSVSSDCERVTRGAGVLGQFVG